jgi:photosystem II stability/assembly factor-like uncharacterized protein
MSLIKTEFNFFLKSLFIILLLSGCAKDKVDIKYEEFRMKDHINLKGICFIDEQNGFLVGGEKGIAGALYETNDGGLSWNITQGFDKCLFDVSFVDAHTGYICGDSILIVRTEDGGESWNRMEYPWLPPDNYLLPLTHIEMIDDTVAFISGGAYFDRGLIFKTRNGGNWWQFDLLNNQIACSNFSSDLKGIFGGYGLMTSTNDGGQSYEPIDIKNDFYTSFHFINNEIGFASGYNGGIYKTSDGGQNWESVETANNVLGKRVHWNDIYFRNNEKGIVVGNNGELLITEDGGSNWKHPNTFTDMNLYSVNVQNQNFLWITAASGYLFRLEF